MSSKLCPFCMRMAESEICPHCGKNINYAGTPTHLPAGFVVHGKHSYVIGAALGQGGFGITYIALDMVTNERVAIKEYFPTFCCSRTSGTIAAYPNQDDVFLKGRIRFLDEARMLKSLSDLNFIVNVLDFFEFNNSAYLVMEYLDGSSLKDYAAKHGKFPAQAFLNQIRPLMEDIEQMHQRGVVHRDIAPDNIILLPDGQLKLIDFGAARSFVGDKSMTVVVKKGFAPIEQYFSSGANACSDVYALSATIYYCITGVVPMDSAQRQNDNTPLGVPSSLGADIAHHQDEALLKALAVQQKFRTQSIRQFQEQLFASPVPVSEAPAPEQPPVPQPTKKKSLLKIIIPAVAALVVLAAILFLNPNSNSGKYVRGYISYGRDEYAAAAQTFAELGDFWNSHALWEKATYAEGKRLYEAWQYGEAALQFQQLGHYEDSYALWEESVYLNAEFLLSESKYENVLSQLDLIPNYEKTYDLRNECLYQRGSSRLELKKYQQAYEDLSQVPESYKQNSTLLHSLKMDWAKVILADCDSNEAQVYREAVTLTLSESDELYDYIISKDFYDDDFDYNASDFNTRKYMLGALVGNYPLKDSLSRFFESYKDANAEEFIKSNRNLILKLWDVPVMQNVIGEDWNMCVWLLGKWKTSSGSYLEFYQKDNDDSIWCSFNLPWVSQPAGTEHWDLVDMEFIWTDGDYNKLASVYHFNLLSPDTMEVYCYKNSTTYTVTRNK